MSNLPEWAYAEADTSNVSLNEAMSNPTLSGFAGCGLRYAVRDRWSLESRWPKTFPEEDALIGQIAVTLPHITENLHTMGGVIIPITNTLPAYVVYLILNEAYEYGDIELVRTYVEPGDKALVFGAGLGVVATALAQQSAGKVYAVDANPELAPAVRRVAELNGVEIEFIHGAVAFAAGEQKEISFVISKEFWSSSISIETRLPKRTLLVPSLDANKLIEETDADTVFVDIEGAEVILFEQAIASSVKKLFVEIHTPNVGTVMYAKIMNDIYKQGFRLRDSRGLTLYFVRK